MLTFTENMSRIEYLTAQTLVHVQKENYQKVREDLVGIHVHTSAAQQQLDELQWMKTQDGIPSKQSSGGP